MSGPWIETTSALRRQPVAGGVQVEVKLRSGVICRGPAKDFCWVCTYDDSDVMAYRKLEQNPGGRF